MTDGTDRRTTHALKVQEVEKMKLRTEQLRKETASLRRTLATCASASPEPPRPAALAPPLQTTPTPQSGYVRRSPSPASTRPFAASPDTGSVMKLTEVVADLRRRLDMTREDAREQERRAEERIRTLELDLELARTRATPAQSNELYTATQTIKAQGESLEQLRALCLTQQDKLAAFGASPGDVPSPPQRADYERRLRDAGEQHGALQCRVRLLECENTLLNTQLRDLQKELELYRTIRTASASTAHRASPVPVSNPIYTSGGPQTAAPLSQPAPPAVLPPPSHQELQSLQQQPTASTAVARPLFPTPPVPEDLPPAEAAEDTAPTPTKKLGGKALLRKVVNPTRALMGWLKPPPGYPQPPTSVMDNVKAALDAPPAVSPAPAPEEAKTPEPVMHLRLPSPLHTVVRDADDINAEECFSASGIRLLKVASPGSKLRGLALLEECGHPKLAEESHDGVPVLAANNDDDATMTTDPQMSVPSVQPRMAAALLEPPPTHFGEHDSQPADTSKLPEVEMKTTMSEGFTDPTEHTQSQPSSVYDYESAQRRREYMRRHHPAPRPVFYAAAMVGAGGGVAELPGLAAVVFAAPQPGQPPAPPPAGATPAPPLTFNLPPELHEQMRNTPGVNSEERVTKDGIRTLVLASPNSKREGLLMLEASGLPLTVVKHLGVDLLMISQDN
eukprot:TRINITY_DN3482_c0_g1_i1.p1 TRINITY_DN3482_c0_g1~~TRINITY_DN3482_c0_g1_i1.p1  ORF type:complete len:750 (+),score=234.97 TRINITY_DN3482_c0_g1_i1:221-2251(+)